KKQDAIRIGEKNPEAAGKAGMQTIFIAVAINIILSALGVIYATDILLLMGASAETAREGTPFIRIMMGGSLIIVLLFLINGIFRGAGNAAIAMKSLWIANIANIILCPLLINGIGSFDGFGLTGAAIATTIGRSIGVSYQLYHLFGGRSSIKVKLAQILPDWKQVLSIIKIAAPGVLQFVIASCSWIFLAKLVANSGGEIGSAGYQTALRLMMFFMLPAWGLSNAAATLVGQNMGAGHYDRAVESVWKTIKYNIIFMGCVMVLFLTLGEFFVGLFTADREIIKVAAEAIRIMSLGFIIYGIGMVLVSTFNGAGDTRTPTWINIGAFWCFQIPFAYLLSDVWDLGATGVFIAIPVAEVLICIAGYILFRIGKWKTVKV
ncbi:MAG: MATE family efflux transporter, partial [Sphingobacteriales bacterium]